MIEYDINDKATLLKAMNAMTPGDYIQVKGNGGPMTVGVPSLESDLEKKMDAAVAARIAANEPRDESWFE